MNTRTWLTRIAIAALLVIVAGGPVAAASGAPQATDVFEREVLQAKLSSTGEPGPTRLYSQLTVGGDGDYTVVDPAATDGLRNLQGFGGPDTQDGAAVWDLEVEGQETLRTVADYDGDLPLEIRATYELDGQDIAPEDLVGRSGTLTTTYTVRNVSTAPTDIEYRDAYGTRTTETVDLPLPLAGQFESTLPRTFADVVADGGVTVGDGRGNTKLKWTLILFEPLGATTQELTYTAEVTDAVVPQALVQVIPVTLEQTPLSSGEAAYSDAADSTYELTQGATTIDRNLLRLATGAGALLEGLVKLSDGATQLHDGLGEAAGGSGELAAGLVKADDGGTDLGAGLVQLSDGSLELSAGMSKARAGGAELAAGLGRLGDGSQQLADGLEAANDGGLQLADGAVAAQQGAAKAARGAGQIEDGMRDLEAGLLALADDPAKLPALIAGIEQYRTRALGGIAAAVGTPTSTFPGGPGGAIVPSARAINAQVKAGLDAGAASLLAAAAEARTSGGQLQALADAQIATVQAARGALDCAVVPVVCGTLDTLLVAPGTNASLQNTRAAGVLLAGTKADALETGGDNLATAAAGMAGQAQILDGVRASVVPGGSADQGLDQLIAGVNLVRDGVRTEAAGGADRIADGQGDLVDGLRTLAGTDGLQRLVAGAQALSDGLEQLDLGGQALGDGAGEAAAGSVALADGLEQLDAGAGALAAGAGTAADGAADLSDGLHRLRDGGGQLAAGLGDAEEGSGQLADGLTMAKIGGEQLADGSGQLNEKGTSVLAASVNEANADQTRNVALVRAMDERSRTDGMPAGAPEGATSSAVYSFELAAADGTGQQNALRLGLAAALVAAMVALGFVRRRVLGL